MCNEIARRIALGQLREDWSQLKIALVFPESLPNLEPLDSVRITDTTLIIRRSEHAEAGAEAVMRRWSWPGAGGRPVYNFRADGRVLGDGSGAGRCLIPADAFYEFTDPARRGDLPVDTAGLPPPAKGRKDKWAFTRRDGEWLAIAGLWRAHPESPGQGGEAFTMLTCPPGPDIAPYHSRQIVILERADWGRWLDGSASSASLCKPLPAGTLSAALVSRPQP